MTDLTHPTTYLSDQQHARLEALRKVRPLLVETGFMSQGAAKVPDLVRLAEFVLTGVHRHPGLSREDDR